MIFLIAAVMLIFTATALAVTYHGDFFHSAYGTAVNDLPSHTEEVYDEDKQTFHTEVSYGTERVDADSATAERLLGEYIVPLELSAELEDYTFTVHDIALDENGIGAVTIDVKNPNGHGLHKGGIYDGRSGEFCPFYFYFEGGEDLLGSAEIIADEGFSDTFARIIAYVSPFRPLDPAKELTLYLCVSPRDDSAPLTAEITIPAVPRVPVKALKSDLIQAELSPLGLHLTFLEAGNHPQFDICFDEELPEEEALPQDSAIPADYYRAIPSKVVICFDDGTAFTAYDDETLLMNVMQSSCDETRGDFWMAFNRIVDVDSVTGIRLGYTEIRGSNAQETEASLLP